MNDVIEALAGQLVVSCQAYPGEPMLDPKTMTQIAQAAVAGGAAGIRGKGLEDLRMMRAVLQVPLIGLVKVGKEGVFITPTLADCLEVAATGCQIVALDGTRRPRPDGLTLAQTIAGLREQYPDVLVMADCGSVGDAIAADEAGADLLGTTLAVRDGSSCNPAAAQPARRVATWPAGRSRAAAAGSTRACSTMFRRSGPATTPTRSNG